MASLLIKRRTLASIIGTGIIAGSVALCGMIAPSTAYGAGPISFSGTYTQDFQSMTGTAILPTSIPATTMSEVSSLSGGGSVDGWYVYGLNVGTGPRWGINDGTSTTGQFGQMVDSIGDRALGSTGSGNNAGFFGIVLQNTTGSTINQFSLNYDAMMNVGPKTTPNAYPVSWMVSSTTPSASSSIGAGTFNDAAGSWNATTFGFTTPPIGSGTGAPNSSQPQISPLFQIDGASKGGTISSAGWGPGQYLYIRWTETDEASSDAMAGVDNFSLAQIVAATVTWNTGSGTWNTTTGNWINGSPTANLFKTSDNVLFNNSAAGGAVTIQAGGVAPTSTLVNNDANHPYIFQNTGADANGITTGDLTKSGTGTLTLKSPNTYTGGTHVNGGTLIVDGGDDRLGNSSGGIGFAGGALRTATVGLTSSRLMSVGTGGGTFDTNGLDSTLSGAATINDMLTKTGSGNLTLSGALTFGATGSLHINSGGTITLTQTVGPTSMFNGGVFDGDLIVNSVTRINFNTAGQTYGGVGQIKILGTALGAGSGGTIIPDNVGGNPGEKEFLNSNALISNLSGQTAGTITSDIVLNPTGTGHVAFTPGDITTANYTTASFLAFIGGTNGAINDGLIVNGKITGEGDLFIGNDSEAGGGSANLTLNNANTYLGNTLINTGGVIKIGVTNALPITTNVIQGSLRKAGDATLDLNGHDQQIASLSDDVEATLIMKKLTITNNAAADSVLTVSGSVTPANPFGGVISDGPTNKVSLVKGGTNTLTLTGTNTYNGDTTVSGGTLNVNGSHATAGSYNIGTSGNLSVNGTILSTGDLNIGLGTVTVASAASLTVQNTVNSAGNGSISVNLGGTMNSNNIRTDALTLDGAATINANGGAAGTSKVETLNMTSGTGQLNLKNNDLVIGTGSVSDVRTLIKAGLSGTSNTAATTGITSDMMTVGKHGFGYAAGNDTNLSPALGGSLSGQTFGASSVLVKYTYLGDADLDGDVDVNDFSLWASNFTGSLNPLSPPTKFWTQGDFDYDGDVDVNDFSLWASNFTGSLTIGGPGSLIVNGASLSVSSGVVSSLEQLGVTVVPEPSMIGLFGIGLVGLAIVTLRKRRTP